MINIRLSNQDFGLKNEGFTDNCRIRYSSRGIIYNPKTDKIAIIAKTRLKECKLPGGGKEGNETDEESFQREVLEETGCKVKIIQKLGDVYEERSSINQKQYSTVYLSELIEDTGKLNPTEKEINEGLTVKWASIEEAIEAVRDSYDSFEGNSPETTYVVHFIIRRDLEILKAYKAYLVAQKLNN